MQCSSSAASSGLGLAAAPAAQITPWRMNERMRRRCLATLFAFYQHLLPLPPSSAPLPLYPLLFPESPVPSLPLPLPSHDCPLSSLAANAG